MRMLSWLPSWRWASSYTLSLKLPLVAVMKKVTDILAQWRQQQKSCRAKVSTSAQLVYYISVYQSRCV